MIRIAVGYVAIVALCAVLILLNPLDFMGRGARDAQLAPAKDAGVAGQSVAGQTVAGQAVAKAPTAAPSTDSLSATTAAILADLTAAAEDKAPDPAATALAPVNEADEVMRKMSAAVLEGLRGGAEPQPATSLEGLVAQALAAGQTDAAIDRIVNEAVAEGKMEAPAMLRTAEGKVDTAVLLAAILQEAQGEEFGQGDLSEPTEAVEGGTLAMQVASEDVIYTVQPGDSLGSLALRFYGDAGLYTAIFKANRQVMETPESLSYGMKLLIPARSGL